MLTLMAICSAAALLVCAAMSRNDDTKLVIRLGVIVVLVLGVVGQTVMTLLDSWWRR